MKNTLKERLESVRSAIEELGFEVQYLLRQEEKQEQEIYDKAQALTKKILPAANFHNLTDADIKVLSRDKEWKELYEIHLYYDQFFGYDYNKKIVDAIDRATSEIEDRI